MVKLQKAIFVHYLCRASWFVHQSDWCYALAGLKWIIYHKSQSSSMYHNLLIIAFWSLAFLLHCLFTGLSCLVQVVDRCYAELDMFNKRWQDAAQEDKCWTDPYPQAWKTMSLHRPFNSTTIRIPSAVGSLWIRKQRISLTYHPPLIVHEDLLALLRLTFWGYFRWISHL